jgi:hypothetical protein
MLKMMTKNHLTIIHSIVMISFICALLMIWPPLPARAGGGGPPLPPRLPPPSDQPSNPERRSDDDDSNPVGAYIELQTLPILVQAWTVVQWQDQIGGWHEVEGWHGTVELDGSKRWWVAAKDFGKGPFRWVVMAKNDGQPLATSLSFNLPSTAYEVVQSEVSLNRRNILKDEEVHSRE